jgi:type I restriction enzyme S subunit
MIPEGWEHTKLESIIKEYREKSTIQDQFEVLTSSRKGLFSQSEYFNGNRLTERNNIGYNIIPPNHITYRSRSDDGIFVFNINKNSKTGIISHFYPVFSVVNSDTDFIVELLNYYKQKIGTFSVGTSQTVLSMNALKGIKLPLPPFPEQKKIARILSTWDKAIETVDKLIENSQQQKKALMQQLLTGKKRLPGFSGGWKTVRIGDVVQEVRRRVDWDDNNLYHLISVKRRSEGLFLRESLPGNKILTKKMKIARAGDFLISKMQVLHGATGLVTSEFDGLHISDSYIALTSKDPSDFSMEFFNWLSKTKFFYHLTFLASYGVHIEKMTFDFRSFLKMEITIPPTIQEQKAIAERLDQTFKSEKKCFHIKAYLEKEKQALMQQLLTGKRRVKIDEEDRSSASVE